ncbi:MAG: hypothetical protein DMG96_34795 [Acidobacteria bacterium]|nr:MAG: hypothetical protein DMG96_34795 [Acidobacteriota bacterium]
MAPPFSRNQGTFVGGYPRFCSDRSDAAEASGRPATFARKTFNVQPFPKMRNDKEHRCEIAKK